MFDCCATPFQYSHFWCEPAPSNEITTNCGGFSPGFNLVGVKNESGSTPAVPCCPVCWPVCWVLACPVGAPPPGLPPFGLPTPPAPGCPCRGWPGNVIPGSPAADPLPPAVPPLALCTKTVKATAAASATTSSTLRFIRSDRPAPGTAALAHAATHTDLPPVNRTSPARLNDAPSTRPVDNVDASTIPQVRKSTPLDAHDG